jgi:hypothetical protein
MSAAGMKAALHLHHGPLRLDLIKLVKLALAAARANAARMFPVGRRLEIRVPEWPSAALPRPGTIDGAFSQLVVEEDAVAVGEFLEALPGTYAANILVFEIASLQADKCRQCGNFFAINPDMAGRSGAAVAALRAGKAEAGVVPRQIGHKSVSRFYVSRCLNVKRGTWNLERWP